MSQVGGEGTDRGHSGFVMTGFTRETLNVGWIMREAGCLSLTAVGLITLSTSYGPVYRGASLRDSVLRGMSLAAKHTFCQGVKVGAVDRCQLV